MSLNNKLAKIKFISIGPFPAEIFLVKYCRGNLHYFFYGNKRSLLSSFHGRHTNRIGI